MKRNINKTIHLFTLLIFIITSSILSSSILFSNHVSAYSASITTSDSISLDVSPAGDGTAIHSESINVVSDCRSGYNLSISTPNGSDLYKYTNGVADSTASFTAVDGTSALSGSNNTNKWGFVLSSNPTSSTVFSPLSTTPAIIRTSTQTASLDSDINDTFSIHYGIKVDNTIESGTYQMADNGSNTPGSIVYYLTMDATCSQYTVAFNPNGGTVTSGSTNPEQNIQQGEPTKLLSSDSVKAPTTASYTDANNNTVTGEEGKLWTFWGWNTNIDGTGDWYKDRESIEDLVNAGSTITFYAQWKQATLNDLTAAPAVQPTDPKQIDHNTMQDMSPETCWNSTAYSTDTNSDAHNPFNTSTNPNGYHTITLNDYRGKVTTGENPEQPEQYTVTKLADGLCWMTTNLNLGRASGGSNNDGTITLTGEDTDISSTSSQFILPAHTTTSSTTNTAARIRITNNSGDNANGAYYSWAAAVAFTISTNVYMPSSICPKNWDLPTSSQFTNLSSKSSYSSSNQTTAAPSSFLVNGGFTNGASFYQTGYSHFWTSTSSSSTAAYGARINSTTITTSASTGTTYGGNKYYEKNIRCVANNGLITIQYDGNGNSEYPATGTIEPSRTAINAAMIQNGSSFTRNSFIFNGWNTEPDGSGETIAYSVSGKPVDLSYLNLKPGSTITLYAQWIPQYTITYVNNCKSWASSDTNCTDANSATTSNQPINLANNPSTGTETATLGAYNKFTMTGWKIKEWTTNADGTGTTYPVASTYTVPAGSSGGDGVTLYAHWVPIYTVQYDGNGSDNDSTGMGSTDSSTGLKSVRHTNVAEGDTFDLFASNFKRAGYGFVGWSTDSDAWSKLTDNDTTNDAKIWGPNEIITAPAYNGTPITTLYAIWAPAEKTDPSNPSSTPVYLQGWTGCSAMTATTYDTTTGKLTVAKNSITLADENCWMVENLRLDNTPELSTTNTNIDSTNSTLPITNVYGSTTSNYLSATSSSWCTTDSAACDDQSLLNTTNTIANITPSQTQSVTSANAHTNFSGTIYSYGNYYNWYSATAGYGTFSRSTGEPTAGDLCPTGWKLPYGNTGTSGTTNIGGTKGGFSYLDKQMGGTGAHQSTSAASNKWRMFPNNFVYSGFWSGSSAYSRGNFAFYWSASAFDALRAYSLSFDGTLANPGNSNRYKYYGYVVRCVAGS